MLTILHFFFTAFKDGEGKLVRGSPISASEWNLLIDLIRDEKKCSGLEDLRESCSADEVGLVQGDKTV